MSPKSFAQDIKPYFTPCFRAHMIVFGLFDLWSAADVTQHSATIINKVEVKRDMPPKPEDGGCPEGGWDDITRNQFLNDFKLWLKNPQP